MGTSTAGSQSLAASPCKYPQCNCRKFRVMTGTAAWEPRVDRHCNCSGRPIYRTVTVITRCLQTDTAIIGGKFSHFNRSVCLETPCNYCDSPVYRPPTAVTVTIHSRFPGCRKFRVMTGT